MTFTKEQTELLNQPIDPKNVETRDGNRSGSLQLAYVESWHVIKEANRIFGFDGWSSETIQLDCVQSDDLCVTYIANLFPYASTNRIAQMHPYQSQDHFDCHQKCI